MSVILDRKTFDREFNSTTVDEPDPWRRVAAKQFDIPYYAVTSNQRAAMKKMYFGYVYSIGPVKFRGLYDRV